MVGYLLLNDLSLFKLEYLWFYCIIRRPKSIEDYSGELHDTLLDWEDQLPVEPN